MRHFARLPSARRNSVDSSSALGVTILFAHITERHVMFAYTFLAFSSFRIAHKLRNARK